LAGRGNETVEQFIEFARRYSIAERAHRNAASTGSAGVDTTLSLKQAIEHEVANCFVLTKKPNWKSVEEMALGGVG
jgi:hypothetical protein